MGDAGTLAELRPVLVIMSFVSVFVVLAAMIPAQFAVSSPNMDGVTIPTAYEAYDIVLYNSTELHINHTGGAVKGYWGDTIDIANSKIIFQSWNTTNQYGVNAQLQASYYIFYPTEWERMTWTINGEEYPNVIYYSDLDTLAGEYDDLEFHVVYGSVSRTLIFHWNTTTYSNPSTALDADGMRLIIGVTWNELETKINAFTLLTQILFFSMPDIHWALNAILAIPLWIGIVYVLVAIARSLIPFL